MMLALLYSPLCPPSCEAPRQPTIYHCKPLKGTSPTWDRLTNNFMFDCFHPKKMCFLWDSNLVTFEWFVGIIPLRTRRIPSFIKALEKKDCFSLWSWKFQNIFFQKILSIGKFLCWEPGWMAERSKVQNTEQRKLSICVSAVPGPIQTKICLWHYCVCLV